MPDLPPQHTILVVDAEEDFRLALATSLSTHYRVWTAVDGMDALDQITAAPAAIDLVITELHMPRMDGMVLGEKISAEYPHIGIIMSSDHGTIAVAVKALKSGIYDYITKPLPEDLHEIHLKCQQYFHTRDLREQRHKRRQEILKLSYFPRSNPHFVARATIVTGDVILHPGNEKATLVLGDAAGSPPDEQGCFRYLQGAIHQLFPPDFQDILHRIIGTNEVVEIDRLQAEQKYYHHTYTPFVDNRSEIFINLTDITRQVENEQLRMMLEAGMEHEFKNLLMQITPNAEMLYYGLLGPLSAEQKENSQKIIQGGQQLLESLNDRLEFSRAYSGQLQLQKTQINFYTLAQQVYDDLNSDKVEKVCKIEGRTYPLADVDLPAAEIFCDPQYIKRVLNNLIGNALNYGSWVDTRIQLLPDHALITVRDGGGGLDEEDATGIWTLGYRAKNRKKNSTGIGLPYSKLIVEAHRGEIGLNSILGEGTTFHFTLPTPMAHAE